MRRSPCRSWRRPRGASRVAHVTLTTLPERRRRRGRSASAERSRLPRAGPHRTTSAPPLPAASFLTIICVLLVFYHYYSLVLFYVLSSASRSHRRPCAASAAQIIASAIRAGIATPRSHWQRHLVTSGSTTSCKVQKANPESQNRKEEFYSIRLQELKLKPCDIKQSLQKYFCNVTLHSILCLGTIYSYS